MVDFRFHLFTVTALFLALGVGLLLGMVAMDNQAFAEKEGLIISQLEKDFQAMRQRESKALARAQSLERELVKERAVLQQMAPFVIKGRLVGRKIAIISAEDQASRDTVVRVLAEAGAEVVTDPWGELSDGAIPSFDSIVFVSPGTKVQAELENQWFGWVERLSRQGVLVVGAEASDTKASMSAFFQRHGVGFVDHIDHPAGQVALVYLLLGAQGHYGSKPGAEGLIPPLLLPGVGVAVGGR